VKALPAQAINGVTRGYADGNPLVFCVPFCACASSAATISCHFDWSEFVPFDEPAWFAWLSPQLLWEWPTPCTLIALPPSVPFPLLGTA
jgi:hypothetical protein